MIKKTRVKNNIFRGEILIQKIFSKTVHFLPQMKLFHSQLHSRTLMSTNFLFRRSRSTINLVSTISTLVILENSAIVDFSLQIIIFQISDLQLRSKSLKKYCRQESTKKSTINKGGN